MQARRAARELALILFSQLDTITNLFDGSEIRSIWSVKGDW